MKYDDPYKYMISGYYGIELLDEYKDKIYLLNDIKRFIDSYLEDNRVEGFDYEALNSSIEKERTTIEKFQDALLLLHDMNGPMEVNIILRQKIEDLRKKD